MLPRFARVLLVTVFVVLFVLLLNLLLGEPSASSVSAGGSPTPTSELAPTATPTEWLSPTALLTVSAAGPTVGDLLTVTTHLVTTGTCGFTLYNVTLSQTVPLFTHVDPPINMVDPPGMDPADWRLAARQPGVTVFTAHFYGESRCGGSWQWTTLRGESQPVTVTGVTHFLPFVPRTVPPVRLIDLGTLGGDHSYAAAINDRGQVVGASENTEGKQHAVLWLDGVTTDLGTLGGESSYATAINERGQVVGSSVTANHEAHAFLWQDGIMTDLGALNTNAGLAVVAVDINRRGEVIGNSSMGGFANRSFLWANGVVTDLGTLGGDTTWVRDINDRGQIVGSSETIDGSYHAFLWEDGVMTDLNLAVGEYSSEAAAINERGQIVGVYNILLRGSVGFLWDNGVVTDFSNSLWYDFRIEDFNERGQAVGSYSRDGSNLRPFLWSDGVMTDLGVLRMVDFVFCPTRINEDGLVVLYRNSGELQGPVLWKEGGLIPLPGLSAEYPACAQDINNLGRVVGQSSPGYGVAHAVLWETFAGAAQE